MTRVIELDHSRICHKTTRSARRGSRDTKRRAPPFPMPSSAAARRSRSSGLTRKPSMPASRQASRSSAEALAVSARIGVRGVPVSASVVADPARRFEAVHARHVQVHEHAVEGMPAARAASQDFDRRFAAVGHGRVVAELDQEGAREQRVDLVILGDEDRQPASACCARRPAFRLARSRRRDRTHRRSRNARRARRRGPA